MEEYGLTRQKLFILKRGTLEKRLRTYYYETKNKKATIEMLIALQVRDELTSEADNFSHMLRSVVSRIFCIDVRRKRCVVFIIILQNTLAKKTGNH